MTRLEQIKAIRKLGRRIAGSQAAARVQELRAQCDEFIKSEEAERKESKGRDRMTRSGIDRAGE